MINKNDLRKAISSIAISNAKRNTIYKAFSDLDSITKEEFDSVKSDISKVVESMLTKDTVGKANGVASLDSNGSVPIEQLGNIDTTLFLIVRELPTDNIKSNKIYLVPNQDGQGNNVYIEYIYVEDVWEKVGEFKPDINYDEIINKVKEQVVSFDNNNINGSFCYDDDDNLTKSTFTDSNNSIAIGFNGDIDNNGEQCICIGYGNTCNGDDSIAIGENIFSYDNSVCIGRDIVGNIYNIVLGALFITDNSDDLDGRISIGWKVRNNNISNVIYQIGGYNNNNSESYYNLEETLDYDNDHKKYIYGIGGYDGTDPITTKAKSLQEVLDSKVETIDSTGSTVLYKEWNGFIKIEQDNVYDKPSLFVGETWNEDSDTLASGVIINTNSVELKDESANASLTIHHSGIVSMNGDSTHAYTTDGGIFDLTTKADTSAIPTKVSQLTNDSNFITSYTETDPVWTSEKTNYYTKTEIDGKGYLTAHQSLDGYVAMGNDNTPAQLFKGQGTATINAKQLLLSSLSGGVNIQPDSINIGSPSFTFKASATEGLVLMANSASKGIAFTPGKGIQSIGFDSANVNIEKGGSLVGQNKAGAVYNVNGNFVNLNPLYDLEGKFRDAIAIHAALDNITEATTAEEVVTKFNQLLKSLKAIGLMKPDTTAE